MDVEGNELGTAIVLRDSAGREIDLHALRLEEDGNGFPSWNMSEGFYFQREDLDAEGTISGMKVRCISPQMQMKAHLGYILSAVHESDLENLSRKFGVD